MNPFHNEGVEKFFACAIVAVRDESRHIAECIRFLNREGLDVVILDDGSVDGTADIVQSMIGDGVLKVHWKERGRTFNLSDQLRWKALVAENLPHRWILHVDADEWLQSPEEDESLIDLLKRADESGSNCVNFREFTFVPIPDVSDGGSIRETLRCYYYFAPSDVRLMRAFRRDLIGKNIDGAGHVLVNDDIRMWKEFGVLRHYPILGARHLKSKYGHRIFDAAEVSQGWHYNRLHLRSWNLDVIDNGKLRTLSEYDSKTFDQSMPSKNHFWEAEWNCEET
jgi:glycosyltransferase involved in cell wall biosynthesis